MADYFDIDMETLPEAVGSGRKGGGKNEKPKPLFETAKQKTIEGLETSIKEARQRFLGEDGGALPEEADDPNRRYHSSYAWTVPERNVEEPGKGEIAHVSLKVAKGRKMDVFPKFKVVKEDGVAKRVRDGDKMTDHVQMKGEAVAQFLEEQILPKVKNMKKDDGGLGSDFYAIELERAKKATKTKKHNPETDCME